MSEWAIPAEARYELFKLDGEAEVNTQKRGIYYGSRPVLGREGDIWIAPEETREQKAERIGREELSWSTPAGWMRRFNQLLRSPRS